MKHVLIYTGPSKKFAAEDEILIKVQIDNSLQLGYTRDDILLFTDFPFEYNSVKATVLPDNLYYPFDLNAGKIPVLCYLISNNLVPSASLYWCHDLDAYEQYKIDEKKLELDSFDLGLTHYTYKPEWQFGSVFFKTSALDIFELIHSETLKKPHLSRNNEKVLTKLIREDKIDSKRYKRLNPTYNFMKKYIQTIYRLANKPIIVPHFRPSDAMEILRGKNLLKIPLINERLIKIFKTHGIT